MTAVVLQVLSPLLALMCLLFLLHSNAKEIRNRKLRRQPPQRSPEQRQERLDARLRLNSRMEELQSRRFAPTFVIDPKKAKDKEDHR